MEGERCQTQKMGSFYCYLCNDLSVFGMDLNDAPPLCQEGENLVELQEETQTSLLKRSAIVWARIEWCFWAHSESHIVKSNPQF